MNVGLKRSCYVGAELLEANFGRATSVLHDEIAGMKGVLGDSSEAAADKLEQMQRSQIYLEQKMLHEIASEKTALEKMVQQARDRIVNLEAKVFTLKVRMLTQAIFTLTLCKLITKF